jgi:hypothetical protein
MLGVFKRQSTTAAAQLETVLFLLRPSKRLDSVTSGPNSIPMRPDPNGTD